MAATLLAAAPGGAAAPTTTTSPSTASTNTSSTTSTSTATSAATPVVESVQPNHGRTSGWVPVLIDGKNLSASAQPCLFFNLSNCHVSVDFGTNAAFVLFDSPRFVLVIAPPAGTPGTVDVTVTVNGVTTAASPADHFTYE
jgi:hypothetical protein